jgi:hypothetical protein
MGSLYCREGSQQLGAKPGINRYMVVLRAPKIDRDTTQLEERSDLLGRK